MREHSEQTDGISRRKYLGLATAVTITGAGAGCTESAGSRVATEEPLETEGETETQTKTAAPDTVDKHIATTKDALGNAYMAFLNQGDGDTLTAVTAANYPFETEDIVNAIDEAKRSLDWASAGRTSSKQEDVIADLESLVQFFERITDEQEQLATAYWWVDDVPDVFFDESHSLLSDRLGSAADIGASSKAALDTLEAEVDPNAAGALEVLDATAVTKEIEQLRSEAKTVENMESAFSPGIDGIAHLQEAVSYYRRSEYDDAMTEYANAADDFGDAVSEFEDLEPASAFESNVEDMDDATATLEAGCDRLATAAAGKADGTDTLAERQMSLAHEQFDTNDDVADMPSIANGPGGD